MSKTFFDGSKPDGQDSLEKNVRFVAVNTDVQALGSLKNPKLKKVQIGVKTTKGLGAGLFSHFEHFLFVNLKHHTFCQKQKKISILKEQIHLWDKNLRKV